MRDGAEYFTAPAGAAQRRYEALRAYFTEGMPAAEAADRFGYSTASIHQMATLLRKGRLNLFAETRPGPKGPRKATGQLRARALELRAAGHSVTEIAAALTSEGMPVSAQTVWQVLDAEGLPRLPRRDQGRRGPPARLDPVKAAARPGWPSQPLSVPCDHAGLLLLLPAITQTGLPDLVRQAGYPATRELTSWQSIGTLLLAKCARKPRVSHAGTLANDVGLAFTLGLTALPKTTHLGTYSWRVRRDSNRQLLSGLVQALRPLGLATGEAGWSTPGLVETRFSPDALVWVAVVFHGTAAWRNHGLIIFPLLFYRTSVQLRCPAAPPGGGLRPPGSPGGARASPRRAPRLAPRVPRAGQG